MSSARSNRVGFSDAAWVKTILTLLVFTCVANASDWTRFRGPNGTGVAEEGPLPVVFGPGSNMIWETTLPSGKSSPILTDRRIFLTAHHGDKLLTIALDRSTGQEIWRRAAPARRVERMHRLNDEAAPTPVTDGTNVYAFFGGYGLVAYSPDGAELWTLPMGPFTNFHGMGSSPILVDGKLVQVCDQDLDAFVIAVDPADGKILWKQVAARLRAQLLDARGPRTGAGKTRDHRPGVLPHDRLRDGRPRTVAARRTDLPGQVRAGHRRGPALLQRLGSRRRTGSPPRVAAVRGDAQTGSIRTAIRS